MAANLWRHCLSNRLKSGDLLRKDRNSCSSDIAEGFFEGGKTISLPSATIRITPSVIYIKGVNEAVALDTATIIISPDPFWVSDAMKGTIRMVPGLIYIKGINEAVVLDTATIRMITPELSPPELPKITLWAQITIEGSLHCGPAPPPHQYHGSVFRRCPSDRLDSSMLVRRFMTDNPSLRPVASEYFEPGQGVILDTATLHLTGSMSYAGIDANVTLEGTIRMVPQTPTLAAGIVMEGTIYLVPLNPTVRIFLPPSGGDIETGLPQLCTNIEISQSLQNKVALGSFDFELAETGGYYSGIYFSDVVVSLPDHLGVMHPVFVGFFHSTDANYGEADYHENFPAYDPIWNLGMANLNDADRMILSAESQASQTRFRQYFVFAELQNGWPKVGDIIQGGTTGDFGKIVYVKNYGLPCFEVENPHHGDPLNTSEGYFTDGEVLEVGGVQLCYADGNSIDVSEEITSTPRTIGDWVRAVLGAENWQEETKVEPFNIIDPGVSPVDFIFDEGSSIIAAIERVAKRMSYVFLGRLRGDPGSAIFSGYFIPQGDIDTQLGLPTPVTFALGNEYVLRPIKMTMKGDQKYNRVTIKCQGFDLTWFKAVLGGNEKPIKDYFEINPDLATQAECNTRCADVYNYYRKMVTTWNMTILKRQDLQYLQKLIFSGYGTEIPDDTYRIVAIKRRYAEGGSINEVDVSVVLDADFALYLNLSRVFTDAGTEMAAMARSELLKMGANETGIVTAVDEITGKVTLITSGGQVRTGAEGDNT